MARFRVWGTAVLLVCLVATLSQASIRKDDGDRGMLTSTYDPNSTFDIGALTNVFPLDTVMVPVYLVTTRSVTEIENWITYDQDDLTLLDVVKGPGVPAGATFTWSASDGTLHYNTGVALADSFAIVATDPVAYLKFEVQCFGYGASTDIEFVDDNNYNYYIAGGHSYAPAREDGSVSIKGETWWGDLYMFADVMSAYTGGEDVNVGLHLCHEIPGRLLSAKLVCDMDHIQIDSITADGDYIESFTWDTDGDTILIDVPESNPLLAPGNYRLFDMHFHLAYCDDDTRDYINVVHAERKDECGGISIPYFFDGFIDVPEFTAQTDIAQVNCYNTAEYYQVPVYMDASQPINKYEFYVHFDPDTLEFHSIVSSGSFTPPGAFVTGGNDDLLKITSGVPTNYDPGYLPATVFYIKFHRLIAPYVGQVFDLAFDTSPELTNMMQNYSGGCGYYDAGTLALLPGRITIIQYVPPPPPSCPTLYVWNGASFEKENTVLAACANGPVSADVTDYLLVTNHVDAGTDECRVQIREDGLETSAFTGFSLVAVDHPEKEPVKVTSDGRIISLSSFYGVAWAKDYKGTDITDLVGVGDGIPYVSDESGWFDVCFGKLDPSEISDFIAALSAAQPKTPLDDRKNLMADQSAERTIEKLKVYFKTAGDSWQLMAEQDPRSQSYLQSTIIDPSLIDPSKDLVLRYEWDEYYEIDAVEFRQAKPFDGPKTDLVLSGAISMKGGEVMTNAAVVGPSTPLVLNPGEVIELSFNTESLRPIAKGTVRDYIFVSTGRYEKTGAEPKTAKYFNSLGANYPNPFNPSTTIKFDLETEANVELRIFDVRGALVRTLVSGIRPAGGNEAVWDGIADTGARVSSGVYFYRLKTAGFSETRKMILLR